MVFYLIHLKPLLVLHAHTYHHHSHHGGHRNRTLWAPQPQKSVTLRPQTGGGDHEVCMDMWWQWTKKSVPLY
jgi:hypothetical protein